MLILWRYQRSADGEFYALCAEDCYTCQYSRKYRLGAYYLFHHYIENATPNHFLLYGLQNFSTKEGACSIHCMPNSSIRVWKSHDEARIIIYSNFTKAPVHWVCLYAYPLFSLASHRPRRLEVLKFCHSPSQNVSAIPHSLASNQKF